MTEKDEKLLAEFEKRMKQLMYLCDTLRDENTQLRAKLAQKDTETDILSKQIEQLKNRYDSLRFTKSFASQDKDEMIESKKRLSKLVQDVDKCIALLKG